MWRSAPRYGQTVTVKHRPIEKRCNSDETPPPPLCSKLERQIAIDMKQIEDERIECQDILRSLYLAFLKSRGRFSRKISSAN